MPSGLWKTLVALAYIMIVSSTTYMYSAYSVQLGEVLKLQTTQLNFIASCSNFGTWSGLVSGFLADRYGTRLTAICGGLLSLIGYSCFAAAVSGVACSALPCMSFYAFLWAQGNNWTYFAAIKHMMLVVNQRDTVLTVGVLVSLYSLAAGVFAQVYRGWFMPAGDLVSFFALVGATCFTLAVGGSFALSDSEPFPAMSESQHRKMRWAIGYTLMLITAVTTCAIVSLEVHDHTVASAFAAMMCVLMMGIASGVMLEGKQQEEEGAVELQDQDKSGISRSEDMTEQSTPMTVAAKQSPDLLNIGSDPTLRAAVFTLEYWLCLIALMCGIGSGIVVLNNVGTIVAAFQHDEKARTGTTLKHQAVICVTLFSVFNALGRLGFGCATSKLTHFPRWYFLCGASTLVLVGHLVSLGMTVPVMYGAVSCLGIGYGGLFCMLPTLVRDLFGRQSFGATWGVMGLAPAIPSLAIATGLAGYVVEAEMKNSSYVVNEKHYCLGEACYRLTFAINVGLAAVGLSAAIILARRMDYALAQLR